jgi:hypothetical protein
MQPSAPVVRPERRVEKVGEGLLRDAKFIERPDPPGRCEFGRPHHIELQDVRIRRPGVEPLHVELMTLIGGVGRRSNLDAHAVLGLEPRNLAPDNLAFGAEHASGEGQRVGRAPAGGSQRRRKEAHGRAPEHPKTIAERGQTGFSASHCRANSMVQFHGRFAADFVNRAVSERDNALRESHGASSSRRNAG